MGNSMRTRDVLRDKAGLSTSIIETLGGISLKMVVTVAVGGLLATLVAFWAVTTASAETSSSFQASSLGFEKAVEQSDIVVGIDDSRVGLLTDMPDNKCHVETWQGGSRDGGITLQRDIKMVDGACTSATPLLAVGAGETSQELLFGIDTPVFSYSNLGGREIAFDSTGASTLLTGMKPDDVKLADWDDVRPYKVTLKLDSLNKDTAAAAKKAVLAGFTNVINVTQAADDLRYVPAPSDAPIPGPIRITGVERSTTTGTAYLGEREGIAVTLAGGVCTSGSTKVNVSYTQQGPSAAPAVNTVLNAVLTGADTTVHLGSVRNGSSGAVEVAASCVDGGVVEKASTGYTQGIPATTLTVTQNAAPEKHNLSWVAVSSLPTSYQVTWEASPAKTPGSGDFGAFTGLSTTVSHPVGATYGFTTTYAVTPTVDGVLAPPATKAVSNAWPAAPVASGMTYARTGAGGQFVAGNLNWSISGTCPAGTKPFARHVEDRAGVANTTSINTTPTRTAAWATPYTSATWSPTVPLQGYPYGVSVQTKCVSDVTGAESPNRSYQGTWYTPMTTVAAPVWAAYDRYDTGNPKTTVHDTYCVKLFGSSSCGAHGWSMAIQYATSCPAGSSVSWSRYTGHGLSFYTTYGWSGSYYHDSNQGANRGFGYLDGWDTGGSTTQMRYALYNGAAYRCATPWAGSFAGATTAQSPDAPAKVVSVRRYR